MHPFLAASTFARIGDKRFTTTIEPAWLQGKGAFGGLLNAGVVRAMSTLVDASRRIRTLHVHFCAPAVPGTIDLDVATEREGASMSTLSARVTQSGALVTLASATFAAPRPRPDDRARYVEATMPDAPAIAALADSYPPAVLARLDTPRASASIDLTIDFFAWSIPAHEHVLVVQTSRIGDGGVTDERCDVWSEGGQLVCSVRQLVALL